MNQTWEKGKNLVLEPILNPLTQIRAAIFFFFFPFKNLALSVTRHLVQLLSGTISEKTNDPILRKPSDGRTHESDFIGHCLTNVKRLIWDKIHLNTTFHFFEIIFHA